MINSSILRPSLLYYNNSIQIPNYIFTENWEAPGMENAWTLLDGGSPGPPVDTADSSTPAPMTLPTPIEGSYYLFMRHDFVYYTGHIARLFYTVQNEIWGAFLLWKTDDTMSSAGPLIDIYLNSDPQHILIMNDLTLKVNATTYGKPNDNIAAETWTYVWFHYKKAPNSVFQVCFSTDGIKPSSGTKFFSTVVGAQDGTLTYSADTIDLTPIHNTLTILDKIRLATTNIGSNYP